MKINFVTANEMKFKLAQSYFEKLDGDYELVQYDLDIPEIQNESVEVIARQSAESAAIETGIPCIKMDVGLYIPALKGFPGPFVKYINDWLTQDDFLKLMENKVDRSAYFEDATAIGFPDGTSKVFSLKNQGSIAMSKDPVNNRWPANLLFIPTGYTRTLGSMSDDEQNKYWGDGNWPKIIEFLEHSS
jgi:non-canonical purine NTP pyrophosphatase (RdgB/HAM1 family)